MSIFSGIFYHLFWEWSTWQEEHHKDNIIVVVENQKQLNKIFHAGSYDLQFYKKLSCKLCARLPNLKDYLQRVLDMLYSYIYVLLTVPLIYLTFPSDFNYYEFYYSNTNV